MNKLRIHERICTSCSEHAANVHAGFLNTCLTYTPTPCMVLTTPVKNACILSAKNAYGLVHACLCNGAEASLPWRLLRTYLESCASIVQAVVCRSLLPPLLLSRPNPSSDAVRSRNPSKPTLAHDVVAVAVSHKHHSIIRVGAGLIQFVYGSWCSLRMRRMHFERHCGSSMTWHRYHRQNCCSPASRICTLVNGRRYMMSTRSARRVATS